MRRLCLAVMPLIALLGCTRTPAETARATEAEQATANRLAARLAGLTPGRATSCLPTTLIGAQAQTQGYGSTILYIAGRDLIYRNDTTGGCDNIGRGDILVTRQFAGRACRGDIATTVEPLSRAVTGSCALGDFIPYRRAR